MRAVVYSLHHSFGRLGVSGPGAAIQDGFAEGE